MNGITHAGPQRLLFVCTGNYFRSRLAEILFNHCAVQSGLPWRAESRGLAVSGQLSGLAIEARAYAEAAGVAVPPGRNPKPLLVDELAGAGLVVLMNRQEHEPIMEREFRPVYRSLVSRGTLRSWNVFDLPSPRPVWGGEPLLSQPAVSSTEHIDFAVRTLIAGLAGSQT